MRSQRTSIQILPLEEAHYSGILTAAEGLPEWFDEHARSKSIPIDWSCPTLDAVAELIKRKSAVGKTAICGLNSGSISPMFSCIGTEFRIRQQHRFSV